MNNFLRYYDDLTRRLQSSGDYVALTLLRAILFWEFFEAGLGKLNGENWFSHIQDKFPFPFSALGADLNWLFATWGELIFSVLLLLGLFTRFAAFSLLVITAVATAAVHWPGEWGSLSELWKGYAISDKGFGNFKLPLLFILMLLPLVFYGGGKLSLDCLLRKFTSRSDRGTPVCDLASAGLAILVPGLPLIFLMPVPGTILVILGAGAITVGLKRSRNRL